MTQHTVNLNINENKEACESQKQRILEFLLTGCSLTPLQALDFFGTMKLASRVSEIKQDGFHVNIEMVTINGKRVAKYSM